MYDHPHLYITNKILASVSSMYFMPALVVQRGLFVCYHITSQ